MKNLFLYFLFLALSLNAIGQSCLPDDTFFYTQEELDDFYVNNPDCNTIEGNLYIWAEDLTNLNGLQKIQHLRKDCG